MLLGQYSDKTSGIVVISEGQFAQHKIRKMADHCSHVILIIFTEQQYCFSNLRVRAGLNKMPFYTGIFLNLCPIKSTCT